MKFITVLLLIWFSVGFALAFPSLIPSAGYQYQPHQPIDISDEHVYQAPSATDQRGPCPGLNALANHGYINRNGISTPQQVFDVCLFFGFDVGVSAFLATLAVQASNGLVFSIGNGSLLTGLGLNFHNFLEGDTSYKSCDCNLCFTKTGCDNFDFDDSVWSITYKIAQLNDNLFGLPTFTTAAKARYNQSRETNPNFFFGPIQLAFHYLTPCIFFNIFPNGTDGIPTEDIANTWIGIIKDANGQRSGIPGGGMIPDNWYPRQTPFDLVEAAECILELYTSHPVLLGANINGTFVADEQQLPSQPTVNDIICFLYETILGITSSANFNAVSAYLNEALFNGTSNCTAEGNRK